mmetsp:Transcript_3137/g.6296  ORF Transcript_3137/g.6296 Transcript_3137/m.6296 type:complete len:268 (+) Transcript_3137:153-956(+)
MMLRKASGACARRTAPAVASSSSPTRRIAFTALRNTGCTSPGSSLKWRRTMTTRRGAPLLITCPLTCGPPALATAANMKHAASATSGSRGCARMTMTKDDIMSATNASSGRTLRSQVQAMATHAETETATSPGRAFTALINPATALRHASPPSSEDWCGDFARAATTVQEGMTTDGWFQYWARLLMTSESPSSSSTRGVPVSASSLSHTFATTARPRPMGAGRGEGDSTTASARETMPPLQMMKGWFSLEPASTSSARRACTIACWS